MRQTDISQALSAELQLENKLQEKNPQNYRNQHKKSGTSLEATGKENAADLKCSHIHHHTTKIYASMSTLIEKQHMHYTGSKKYQWVRKTNYNHIGTFI